MTTIDQGLYTGARTTSSAPLPSDAPRSAFHRIANDARRIIERLTVAETTFGALAPLRWALVIVFLWFGGMKFDGLRSQRDRPVHREQPIHGLAARRIRRSGRQLLHWLSRAFDGSRADDRRLQRFLLGAGSGHVIGDICDHADVLADDAGSCRPTAGGFPAISAGIGQFLLKDVVLACCIGQSAERVAIRDEWKPSVSSNAAVINRPNSAARIGRTLARSTSSMKSSNTNGVRHEQQDANDGNGGACRRSCSGAARRAGAAERVTRTDLQRHDLSHPGREAIEVRLDLRPRSASTPTPAKRSSTSSKARLSIRSATSRRSLKAGDVLFVPANTPHSARIPGSVTGSELATYIVEKGKPLLTLVK